MSRGYYLRLLLWALCVLLIIVAAYIWSVRTIPNLGSPTHQVVLAETKAIDPFPIFSRWISRPFNWLLSNYIFVIELAFLLFIARGWFGRSLGVYDLVHADEAWVRFVNGVLYGLAVGNCLFVMYVTSEARVPWPVMEYPTLFPVSDQFGLPGEANEIRRAGNFLFWILLPLLLCMTLGKLSHTPWISIGMMFALLVVIAFVEISFRLLSLYWQQDWRAIFAFTPGAADGQIPVAAYPLHMIATAFTVMPFCLIVLQSVLKRFGLPGNPVWIVCLSMWLFNALYGFISFHFWGLHVLIAIAVLSVVVIANLGHPYKLSLPGLGPEYHRARQGQPIPMGVTESPVSRQPVRLIPAEAMLQQFQQSWLVDHPPQSKPKLLILCTSGGGIRAAIWTAAVINELESQLGPDFGRQLKMITGASGGMLGAGLYAGRLLHPLRPGLSDVEAIATDSLWPTWQEIFFNDWPGALLPFHRDWDRGYTLEQSWARNTPGQPGGRSPFTTTFAELHQAELAGKIPSLIFSPFLVEDGRRVLISNLELSDLAIESAPTVGVSADGTAMFDRQRISQPAVEFFRLFPEAHSRFTVSTAARLSASFPYISPAIHLPTTPVRRVVDAGFYDNYGVSLAAGWLLRNHRLIKEHCSGVAIIEVRAFPLEIAKTGLPDQIPKMDGLASTLLAGISTPLEALGTLQSAGAYYRNDQLLTVVDDTFNLQTGSPFFIRMACECLGDGALSWAVNKQTRDDIVSQIEPLKPTIQAFKKWFQPS